MTESMIISIIESDQELRDLIISRYGPLDDLDENTRIKLQELFDKGEAAGKKAAEEKQYSGHLRAIYVEKYAIGYMIGFLEAYNQLEK